MHSRHIDLLPGQSIRVGNKLVTLLEINDGIAEFSVEEPDSFLFVDPVAVIDCELEEPALA
ncbi:MAG: hypothetical protein KDA85_16690 [Planctomycetaceae bacterium]|nr:hypothetical protein [Planctomycetaceae bacterium]